MSLMKRYLEDQSVRMGYEGAITPEVIANLEDSEYLYDMNDPLENELIRMHQEQRDLANAEMEEPVDVKECQGCDSQFQTEDPSAEFCGRCTTLLNDGELS